METAIKPGSLRAEAAKIKGFTVQRPNLDDLDPWLKENISEPFEGFQDVPNGKSRKEQLEATHNQLRRLARTHRENEWPEVEIEDMLMEIVTPDSEDLHGVDKSISKDK